MPVLVMAYKNMAGELVCHTRMFYSRVERGQLELKGRAKGAVDRAGRSTGLAMLESLDCRV